MTERALMFYSKSTNGFYSEEIHGARQIERVSTDPDTGETLDRLIEPNPDCKIPPDAVEITDAHHADLLAEQSSGKMIAPDAAGQPVAVDPPSPTMEQTLAAFSGAVQRHLDSTAQGKGYNDIMSAVTYADEPSVPTFQADGRAFRAWRSKVWADCAATLSAVQSGVKKLPSADELIDSLPELELP